MNAGIPAMRMAPRIILFSAAAIPWLEAAKPTHTPIAIPIPPILGVGVVCTFCTPLLESMEKLPCHFWVKTSAKQVINDAAKAINASNRSNSKNDKEDGSMKWVGRFLVCGHTARTAAQWKACFYPIVPCTADRQP